MAKQKEHFTLQGRKERAWFYHLLVPDRSQ